MNNQNDHEAQANQNMEVENVHIPSFNVTGGLNVEDTEKNLDFKKLFESMKCVDCGMIPSPFVRFLCPDGHLHCGQCGESRIREDNATCMAASGQDGKSAGMENKEDLSSNGASLPSSSAECGKCFKKIKRYPSDPIYSALFSQAVWKCPNYLLSHCQEKMKGEDLFDHLCTDANKKLQDLEMDSDDDDEDWLVVIEGSE